MLLYSLYDKLNKNKLLGRWLTLTNKKNKKKQKQKIEIKVTKHAIERYIQRTLIFDVSPTDIQGRLKQAAANGKRVAARKDNAWEVEYNSLILVVRYEENMGTVITCLGTKKYRNWSRIHNRVA